jgi:hypothetical protein
MSEPTTGEIVRALRVCEVGRCIDCNLDEKYPCENLKTCAADHLESQEQTIAALTARAEQAEAREKAIIESLRDRCEFCIGYELEESDDPCNTCYNARTFEPDDIPRTKNWTYRGQPQDGEGK